MGKRGLVPDSYSQAPAQLLEVRTVHRGPDASSLEYPRSLGAPRAVMLERSDEASREPLSILSPGLQKTCLRCTQVSEAETPVTLSIASEYPGDSGAPLAPTVILRPLLSNIGDLALPRPWFLDPWDSSVLSSMLLPSPCQPRLTLW